MDPFLVLLGQCLALFVFSFAAGWAPLCFSCQPRTFKWMTTFGTGLLIGTAFLVIIPEGMHSVYSTQSHEPKFVVGTGSAADDASPSSSPLGGLASVISGSVPHDSHSRVSVSRTAVPHSHAHDTADGHDHSNPVTEFITKPVSAGSVSAEQIRAEEEAKARFMRRSPLVVGQTAQAVPSIPTTDRSSSAPATAHKSAPHSAADGHSHSATPVSVTRIRIGGGPTSRRLLEEDEHDHDHSSHSHGSSSSSQAGGGGGGNGIARRVETTSGGHSHSHSHGANWQTDWIGLSLAGGFLFMLFIDRAMGHGHSHGSGGGHSHSHGGPMPAPSGGGGGGGDGHSHAADSIELGHIHHISASGGNGNASSGSTAASSNTAAADNNNSGLRSLLNPVLFGLICHCAVDGFAMGIVASTKQESLSYVVFIAILAHKIPSAFGLTLYLASINTPTHTIRFQLAAFCASIPVTAILVWLIASLTPLATASPPTTGLFLLFSGGTFLYTVAVHVLPELERSGPGGEQSVGWSNLLALTLGTFMPWLIHVDHSH